MNRTKTFLTAQSLKWVLVSTIAIFNVIAIAGIWYLNNLLDARVTEKNDAVKSSQTIVDNLAKAQTLKLYLENHKDEVDKAAAIVAQATSYTYQNQIVADVTKYANLAGVRIVSFDFPQDIKSAKVDKTTGLKALNANISIDGPVKYTNYLLFLKYIEQNLTKIQITSISISPAPDDQSSIRNTIVGIQVYIK